MQDHPENPLETAGPAIVLVEPQLGENIGTAARAMANFGLKDLRIVNPREGWPNDRAVAAMRARIAGGTRVGVLFGRERSGLTNEEVSLADAILTLPVDASFSSL